MNLIKLTLQTFLIGLFSLTILSCSSSKNAAPSISDKEAIAEIKDALQFKTHFDADGNMDIMATNASKTSLDISDLVIHVEKLENGKFKTFTLSDLQIANTIAPNKAVNFDLELNEWIENYFAGQPDKYNVSIAYKSDKPLNHKEERNIYYISYPHTIK